MTTQDLREKLLDIVKDVITDYNNDEQTFLTAIPRAVDRLLALFTAERQDMRNKVAMLQKNQFAKKMVDELGRPNLTPSELLEWNNIDGWNSALEAVLSLLNPKL